MISEIITSNELEILNRLFNAIHSFSQSQLVMQGRLLPQSTKIGFVCEQSGSCLVLEEAINVLAQASYSACLTISAFVSYSFPLIGPPGCPQCPRTEKSDQFPDESLTRSSYLQPWDDYIASILWSPERGWVHKESLCMSFVLLVSEEYLQKLKEHKNNVFLYRKAEQFENGNSYQIQWENGVLIRPKKQIKRRVGIINLAVSQLRTDIFKPKINLPSLYAGIWYETGDDWKLFNCLKGQLPTPNDYTQIDAFFISGSSHSINDNVPEVEATFQSLGQALNTNPRLKMVGLCFGLQGLAKYNGGEVRKEKFINGMELIHLNKQVMAKLPYMQDFPYSELIMAEHHSDHVVRCPQNHEILAWSSRCGCEAMVSTNKRCLSFQCHPEYSIQFNRAFAQRVSSYKKGELYSDFGLEFKPQFQSEQGMLRHYQSITQVRSMINRFISCQICNP